MSTIAIALLNWLRQIGRRLLQWLIKHGAVRLAHWMEVHVETFKGRLKRAKTERRKRWLRGRIKRWTTAANWLLSNADHVSDCVANEVDALIDSAKGLPLVSKCEKLGRAA